MRSYDVTAEQMTLAARLGSQKFAMTAVVAAVLLFSVVPANSQSLQCTALTITRWPETRWLNAEELEKWKTKFPKTCADMKLKLPEVSQERRLQLIRSLIMSEGLCKDGKIKPRHKLTVEGTSTALNNQAFILGASHSAYCKELEQGSSRLVPYIRYLESNRIEQVANFCQGASSFGVVDELYKQVFMDVTEWRQLVPFSELRRKGKELCTSLRLGDINLSNARIVMQTEVEFALVELRLRASGKMGKELREAPGKGLRFMFAAITFLLGMTGSVLGIWLSYEKLSSKS